MKKLSMSELDRTGLEAFRAQEKWPVAVILEDVRSALNVGSVFRTADAFAIEKVVLCGITAQPPHREILKTALGSTESVSWQHENSAVEAIERLKTAGWQVFAVEQAEPKIWLQDFSGKKMTKKTAFVFGNEVDGVGLETMKICDGCIEIPQFGTKHSLNIAVSVGIVLWETCKIWISRSGPEN